jgi:hypothetical protein
LNCLMIPPDLRHLARFSDGAYLCYRQVGKELEAFLFAPFLLSFSGEGIPAGYAICLPRGSS